MGHQLALEDAPLKVCPLEPGPRLCPLPGQLSPSLPQRNSLGQNSSYSQVFFWAHVSHPALALETD